MVEEYIFTGCLLRLKSKDYGGKSIEINLSLNTMKKMVSPQKHGFLRKEIAHAKCTIIEKQ